MKPGTWFGFLFALCALCLLVACGLEAASSREFDGYWIAAGALFQAVEICFCAAVVAAVFYIWRSGR
jgi:hypothetical protein